MTLKVVDLQVAIIGLGYVGLPLAIEFAKKRSVVGFDITQTRVDELKSGDDHTLEASPEELKAATHLSYTTDLADLRLYAHRLCVVSLGINFYLAGACVSWTGCHYGPSDNP